MIERALEDWLNKTVERNYLPAFCQVLMHQGHKVLYLSSHGLMERGKDLATIGPDGEYYAYQAKTGDITKASWRSYKGEFQELIEFPIDHPTIDKKKKHHAFLVTNGTVSEPVRLDIATMNEENRRRRRGWAKLEVIDRFLLLDMFVRAQRKVVPRALPDMRAFLDLYLMEGQALLPKGNLFDLLHKTVFIERPQKRSDHLDAITGAVVLVSYLFSAFERARNWFALIEGWWVVAAEIARFAARNRTRESDWRPSFDLAVSAIEMNVMELRAEAAGRINFLEEPIVTDGDDLLRCRVTLVSGLLAWAETRQWESAAWRPDVPAVRELLNRYRAQLFFWGESAFPFFFHIVRFLEKMGDTTLAKEILSNLFVAIVQRNYTRREVGFLPPYYDPEEVLGALIPDKLQVSPFGKSGRSYVIRPLLDMLLRRGYDEIIKQYWRKYTYSEQCEFAPTHEWDALAWRSKEGKNLSSFPEPTASLSKLRAEAVRRSVPSAMQTRLRDLLGLHVLVYPFRATPNMIGYLDAPAPDSAAAGTLLAQDRRKTRERRSTGGLPSTGELPSS